MSHLQLVPESVEFAGNEVRALAPADPVDAEPLSDRWRELQERAERLDAQLAPRPAGRTGARVLVPLIAGLTVVLALLGGQPWQLPGRDGGGVADVPQSLLTFLLITAAVCVWVAGRVVRPQELLGSTGAVRLWWGLVAGAAVVSVTAALSLASYASGGGRPGELLVRSAVPLVPALLAGALARADGRTARIRVALGTGLVTVPLLALGWALLASAGSTAGLYDVLGMTLLAGAAPLLIAVAFVAADRRTR